jgi:septal ring factor EnvC (AmiA/AmiB activator)
MSNKIEKKKEQMEKLESRRADTADKLKKIDSDIRSLKSEIAEIERKAVADLVLNKGISVRELERLIERNATGEQEPPTSTNSFNP